MDNERDIETDLKLSSGDYVHKGVKVALSAIPFVGSPISEFFSVVIAPPLEKRRTEWLIEIYQRLQYLEETVVGLKIERLAENENFISTLFYATTIAMRTHQHEKIEALRNAVTNTLIMPDVDANLQLIFINFVDRYTPWHLIILKFLDDPRKFGENRKIKYPNWSMGGSATVLEHTFPELKGRRGFYDQIVNDLYSNGLINSDSFLHTTMTEQGMFASSPNTA
ncbi:hypothetical protein [Methanofollis tationis]|uniref:Uncharacterized protein n=1 Tax=Methanofollis tationis TaxID=81417 RepID=A0A7K4HLA9_9EURY|nr:hypothetical protein [Methanofollis tationis]NVO65827.1 hypothetical protein [Methanofollis tationis]